MEIRTAISTNHLRLVQIEKKTFGRRVCLRLAKAQKAMLFQTLRREGLDELFDFVDDMSKAEVVVLSCAASPQLLEEVVQTDFSNKDAVEFEAIMKELSGTLDLQHGEDLALLLGLSRPRISQLIYRGGKRLLEFLFALPLVILFYPFHLLNGKFLSLKGLSSAQAKYGKLFLFFSWRRTTGQRFYNFYVTLKAILLGEIRFIGPELKVYLGHPLEISIRRLYGVGLLPFYEMTEERRHWPSWLKEIYYFQNESLLFDLRSFMSLFYKP